MRDEGGPMVLGGRWGRIVAVLLLCFFARPLDCSADKVILKSGQEVEGLVIDKNPNYVVVYAHGASQAYPSFDVVRIVEGDTAPSVLAPEDAKQQGADEQAKDICASTNECCRLGNGAEFRREIDQAIKFFDLAIRYDPKNADAYEGRGRAHRIKAEQVEAPMKESEYSEMLKNADEAVKLDPSKASRWILRANALRKLRRPDEAIIDCEKALAIDPYLAYAYEIRANAYTQKGDSDRAISDFSKALGLTNEKKSLPFVLSERASAYLKKGDLVRAEADCDRAMALQPSYPFTHEVRARIFAARKEYEQAWAEVRKVQQLGATVKPTFLEELEKNASAA